jgi:23S rRNA (cytidine1920-2'-O)/16S rRNA (cytidine1409-2'-O)-methyltransferase
VPDRLDTELVRRGLVRSRRHARVAVEEGRVTVDGRQVQKASTPIDQTSDLTVRPDADDPTYASRGGCKLAGALDVLDPLVVSGRRCLDAGASAGGFTDVLLRRGARTVVALDVGHGQLVADLRQDPRVVVRERTSVRGLEPEQIGGLVDLLVADLSFISLTTVLPSLVRLVDEGPPSGDLLLLVKPQFEVGRARLGRGGVVRDPALRALAVTGVARAAESLGLAVAAVTVSPLTGPAGNVEYFVWVRTRAFSSSRRWTEVEAERLVSGAARTLWLSRPSERLWS